MPARILIADDDATIRSLLRRLLERERHWQVCGEASNGVEAIERVKQLDPDVVIMDLSMPVMTGLQAAPEIAKSRPGLPMLLISVEEVSNELANAARDVGYRGVVTKSNGAEVLKGIDNLLRDAVFFSSDNRFRKTASSTVHKITWNPDLLKWVCAWCCRTSDHLREEDAETEVEVFPCAIWRHLI
jgi:DNA-binding NarL/FixJ family response regulator